MREEICHESSAASLGLPQGSGVGVVAHRRRLRRRLPGDPPRRPRRHLGPVGRFAAGVRSGRRGREDDRVRAASSRGRPGSRGRPPRTRSTGSTPADGYLFSVPMWNAGVPYILKQFIDVVSQPGMVFAFDPAAGYTGLLTGKKAASIYTSAVYGPGAARVSATTSRALLRRVAAVGRGLRGRQRPVPPQPGDRGRRHRPPRRLRRRPRPGQTLLTNPEPNPTPIHSLTTPSR